MAIHRRILIQVTLPAVLIGILLFGTCLVGIWSINSLQSSRAIILSKDVESLQAAQEMEICLRQLRFHSFLYLMDPAPARAALMTEDHHRFEAAFRRARDLADLPGEDRLVDAIDHGYRSYRAELDDPAKWPPDRAEKEKLLRWADAHPVRPLLVLCEQLVRTNQEAMEATARDSQVTGEQGRMMLILIGLLGPIGGVISGFGVAWGLSRSITRLHVRMQDVHAHLDEELGTVRLTGVGDLSHLDRMLEEIGRRVRDTVARSQQQEQELLRSEQLAAVGQLAASVAHEVRNPLTSIKLLVGAARRATPPRPLSPEDLKIIHDEVGRLEAKVQALLDFARPPETERESCDLRELVQSALSLVRPRAQQQGVQVEVRLPEQPLPAEVARDSFAGVLGNLFQNALDAMPRGGRLAVDLRQADGGTTDLRVVDTGAGIDPRVADRLFTPFTSTKPTGTGLGLSLSRRIVREHGGTLTGANQAAGGACFTVTLPPPPTDRRATSAPPPAHEEAHADLASH